MRVDGRWQRRGMAVPQTAPRNEGMLAVIRRHPDGVALAQLEQELTPPQQRRMLQYAVGLMAEAIPDQRRSDSA